MILGSDSLLNLELLYKISPPNGEEDLMTHLFAFSYLNVSDLSLNLLKPFLSDSGILIILFEYS